MGECSLTPKRVGWEVEQSALMFSSTMGRVGDDSPPFRRLKIVVIRATCPSVANKRIHVSS